MTNVEALKSLYHALGGDLDDVADVNSIVGMLNAISAKFDGADDAELNAQGIANITEIIGNITADLTTLDVTPTTEAQNIKPTAPIDGYSEVNVSAVTAAIDENITAGNIKKDVQILGVTGDYDPTPTLVTKNITSNGTYNASSDNADGYSSVTVDVASENNAKFGNTPQSFTVTSNLTSIDIPSGVTSIGTNAFQNFNKLASVDIPSSVTSIGNYAFASCTSLTSIDIPSGVTSIGSNAFQDCTNLTTITIHKAESSITGAPWGAPNATVVWDG